MFLCRYGFRPKEFFKAAEIQVWILNTGERIILWVPLTILMFLCMLFAGFYFARFHSVSNVQKIALSEIPGTDVTTIYYD